MCYYQATRMSHVPRTSLMRSGSPEPIKLTHERLAALPGAEHVESVLRKRNIVRTGTLVNLHMA